MSSECQNQIGHSEIRTFCFCFQEFSHVSDLLEMKLCAAALASL